MTTELRALGKDDWNVWYDNLLRAFGGVPEPPEGRELEETLTEYDRSIGAWDGDQCVGTAGAFDFRITVPGGAVVPAAGVTMVSVAATHRRRGVLTSMMRRQLDDIRSWGESLAVLTASEPEIYGRFGYGLASHRLSAEIDTTRVRMSVPPGTDDVRLRYANPADVLDVCEAVYARRVPERPGMLARRPGWERAELLDTDRHRDGASPLQCVVAERVGGGDGDGSGVVGYARFRVKPDWGPGGGGGCCVAERAGGRGSRRARRVVAVPLRHRPDLEDRRASAARGRAGAAPGVGHPPVRLRVKDDLFVRLVDIGAALRARTYQAPLDVVFEVEDSFCPWNEGRWRLTGDPKGATCERTADAADLSLSIRELGAAFLGGVSLASLAAAGRVRELRQGAVAEASTGFLAAGLAPWLPHGF